MGFVVRGETNSTSKHRARLERGTRRAGDGEAPADHSILVLAALLLLQLLEGLTLAQGHGEMLVRRFGFVSTGMQMFVHLLLGHL